MSLLSCICHVKIINTIRALVGELQYFFTTHTYRFISKTDLRVMGTVGETISPGLILEQLLHL